MPATYPPAETLVITVDDTLQAVSLAFDTSAIVIPEPQTQTVVLAMEDTMGQPGPPGPPGVAGSPGPQGPPGGSSNLFQYSFNSQTVSPPGNGQIRLNNSNQQLATLAWISYSTQDNIDSTVAWKFAKAGDKLYIQDKNNSTNAQLYHLTADAVDYTSYAQLAIAWDQTGGNPVPAQICLVAVTRPGQPGPPGSAATINVGTTSTLAPGSAATCVNSGSTSAAVFNFGIPAGQTGSQGATGNQGPGGTAATVNAGTTSTLTPGSNATVTNVGTTSAAVFNFGIPQGLPGTGSGDMLKSVYDTNNNNVVDTCDSLAYSKLTSVPASFTPAAHATTHVTGGSDLIVPASAVTAGLLKQLSGNTTDFVDGTNNCQAIAPQIWSVRLRSYNAIGNPNFEVTQRNIGGVIATPANGAFIEDRWGCNLLGIGASFQSMTIGTAIPGTNFYISNRLMRITLTTQKASLAAGDLLALIQSVEGSNLRELIGDVHSVSLLVQSSVANLQFGLSLRDGGSTATLTKLCTLGAANTPTLISLPNLPTFGSGGGTYSTSPGQIGYKIGICLAAGTSFINSANNVWTSGNLPGAVGQSNFAASPVNSTFDIAFIQHEPGPPTTLQDLDFDTNLSRCQRYYTKSYPQTIQPGSIETNANGIANCVANTTGYAVIQFKRTMAKAPTITGYSPTTGAAGNVRNATSGTDAAVSNYISVSDQGFYGFNVGSPTTNWILVYHYTADTGW